MLQEVELWNPKKDEGKKTPWPEMRADQQEEGKPEKAQEPKVSEEDESEKLFAEDDGSDEKQHGIVPGSSKNGTLG